MHLILCAATRFEISQVSEFFQNQSFSSPDQVETLITGVGLAASVYELTKAVISNKPDLVLQAGIGGSLDESLPLGDTFVISSDTIADVGVEENGNFQTLFNLKLASENAPPLSGGTLQNPHHHLMQNTGLPLAAAISVNEISTRPERIQYYRQQWQAQIESMEGAALHYVCLKENIPFLQIRSVSNYVGERNKNNWRLKESIQNLNKETQHIILKLLNR